jgi:hypothetical protein
MWKPGGYEELNTMGVPHPGTLLVEWIDGSKYVHLIPSKDLAAVAEWSLKKLELRIEERSFRAVRRRDTDYAGEEEE